VPQALSLALGEGEMDGLPELRALREVDGDAEPQREALPLTDAERVDSTVADGLGEEEREGLKVPLCEGEREGAPLALAERDLGGDAVAARRLPLGVMVLDGVRSPTVAVAPPLAETDGEIDKEGAGERVAEVHAD